MFAHLSDGALETLRDQLFAATIALATGAQTAEIHYGNGGEKFHPADPVKTENFLNKVNAEIAARASGCTARGAIFPAGV